jgi:hypothetical protein
MNDDELKRLTEELRKTEDIQSATIRDLRARVADAEERVRHITTLGDVEYDDWRSFQQWAEAWLTGASASAGAVPE